MNLGPVIAALRHVGSYTAGFVTAFALAGMSHDDAVHLADSITQLAKGSAEVLTAIGVITPLVTGFFASRSATSASQVKSIGNMTVQQANQAVASLPTDAKNAIKLAATPPETLVAAAAAIPGVMLGVDTSASSPAPAAVQAVANDPKQSDVQPIKTGATP